MKKVILILVAFLTVSSVGYSNNDDREYLNRVHEYQRMEAAKNAKKHPQPKKVTPKKTVRVTKALNFNGAMWQARRDYSKNRGTYHGEYRFFSDGHYYRLFVSMSRLSFDNATLTISTPHDPDCPCMKKK